MMSYIVKIFTYRKSFEEAPQTKLGKRKK